MKKRGILKDLEEVFNDPSDIGVQQLNGTYKPEKDISLEDEKDG